MPITSESDNNTSAVGKPLYASSYTVSIFIAKKIRKFRVNSNKSNKAGKGEWGKWGLGRGSQTKITNHIYVLEHPDYVKCTYIIEENNL